MTACAVLSDRALHAGKLKDKRLSGVKAQVDGQLECMSCSIDLMSAASNDMLEHLVQQIACLNMVVKWRSAISTNVLKLQQISKTAQCKHVCNTKDHMRGIVLLSFLTTCHKP